MQITSKEQREEVKNKAVEIRESGDRETALGMFLDVIKWDEENGNVRGKVDVLGHLRITYSALANITESEEDKKELKKKALEAVDEAISLANKNKDKVPEGPVATAKVHLASAQLAYANHLEGKEKKILLKEALSVIDGAIKSLPGSKAHQAWPLTAKAEILGELDRNEESRDALFEALRDLHDGYHDEINNNDQAELKLNVWMSGVYLGLAKICREEKKYILAKHYANSVMMIDDPDNHLGIRKESAQKILDELPN